jgi:hypothetical protein
MLRVWEALLPSSSSPLSSSSYYLKTFATAYFRWEALSYVKKSCSVSICVVKVLTEAASETSLGSKSETGSTSSGRCLRSMGTAPSDTWTAWCLSSMLSAGA